VLKSPVQKAKLGRDEEMQTLKLNDQARQLRTASGPTFEEIIDSELKASPTLGGHRCSDGRRTLQQPEACREDDPSDAARKIIDHRE
jgi:hypothetical protein